MAHLQLAVTVVVGVTVGVVLDSVCAHHVT